MTDGLFKRLIGTRDNLKDVCNEIGQPLSTEASLTCTQCTNCYIWVSKRLAVYEDEIPVCHFCADMDTLRF